MSQLAGIMRSCCDERFPAFLNVYPSAPGETYACPLDLAGLAFTRVLSNDHRTHNQDPEVQELWCQMAKGSLVRFHGSVDSVFTRVLDGSFCMHALWTIHSLYIPALRSVGAKVGVHILEEVAPEVDDDRKERILPC